jgi:hypothetical protein
MTDGRVITPPTAEVPDWTERTLSPEGVAAIVSLVEDTGIFGESADYPMIRVPNGPEPPGTGATELTVTLGAGSEQVVVSGVAWFGDEYEATYNLPSPARRALSQLADELSDLSWLPDGAWIDPEPTVYQPQEYLLITSWNLGSNPGYPDIADVAWPFAGDLDQHGEPLQGGNRMLRCGSVDRDEAAKMATQLNGLLDPTSQSNEYWLLNRAPDAAVELWLEPQLPDGFPGCADLLVATA